MLTATAIMCLALNVFHEARDEPTRGQYAVAFVTLNRAAANDDVCKTVFKRDAFSWTRRYGDPAKRYVKIAQLAKKRDRRSWNRALSVAYGAIDRSSKDITKGATYFNEKKMGRRFRTKVASVTIGNHIFY